MLKNPRSAYIHIPFCRRRCYYCDFPIAVLGNKTDINTSGAIRDYVEILCQEIAATPSAKQPLETIFFGGGTPSLLPVKSLVQILTTLKQQFPVTPTVEISLEIDPGTFTSEQLAGYLEAGVNRLSLGVQAFQDEVLQICGRSHNRQDIFTSIGLIQELGITNFSLDLISGLPHQTLAHWQESLDLAISLEPKHISCYDLVLEPVTVFGKRYQPGINPLPEEDLTAQMYRMAREKLTQAGYEHYEISNYAQLGYQCLHNRVYWQNASYYGFGMGATSYVNHQRFTRPRTRQEYRVWVEEFSQSGGLIDAPVTPPDEEVLETLMLGLRLKEGVDLSRVSDLQSFARVWERLVPYQQQGLIEYVDAQGHTVSNIDLAATIRLTDPEGFLFSNQVLTLFFAIL